MANVSFGGVSTVVTIPTLVSIVAFVWARNEASTAFPFQPRGVWPNHFACR